eukprot:12186477-Heterocapsa_arctica.AAC.1
MGHEVQVCGNYEYCLGCGRNTKAKHSVLATTISGGENTVSQSLECKGTGEEIMTLFLTVGGPARVV